MEMLVARGERPVQLTSTPHLHRGGANGEGRRYMLRIVIAEDHEVVRRGVRDLLAAHAGWEVVGEACTGRQALELERETRPDVLVVDLALPELSGIEVIQQSRVEFPHVAACVFSLHEDAVTVADAIAAGARAYVTKSESGARLVEAIESLERHEVFFSPRVSELVMRALVGARG
jgi:DNA-binding NarL/FixJ family response regulator